MNDAGRLAFALIKYFPYGGLQRDFLRIAEACHRQGWGIDVYTPEWSGERPDWLNLIEVKCRSLTNHGRRWALARELAQAKAEKAYAAVVGFSKLPGLDIYFAADSCFAAKNTRRSRFYRLNPRYRSYLALEKAVFSPDSSTLVLLISALEGDLYHLYYKTPRERMLLLPPGIARDRLRPSDGDDIGLTLRAELGLRAEEKLVLMVGSGFKTKGLDRALRALAALPPELSAMTRLVVIGKDNFRPFARLAEKLGVGERVIHFPGRSDIPRFLFAADLLLHPAYRENTGTVLLEALAARLPVLTTAVCGYAGYVKQAEAGLVLAEPFRQELLNRLLARMLTSPQVAVWRQRAADFLTTADIFSLPEKAAEIIIARARANLAGHGDPP